MREKLETLPLLQLRQIAKDLGVKSVTTKKKSELIDAILAADEARKAEEKPVQEAKPAEETNPAQQQERPQNYRPMRRPRYEGQQREGYTPRDNQQRDNNRPQSNNRPPMRNEGRTRRFDYSAAAAAAAESQDRPEQPANPESNAPKMTQEQLQALDSGIPAFGILEMVPDQNFGFIRGDNYLPCDQDVYVAPSQIHKFNLKTGDIISGSKRIKTPTEKFAALLYINEINGRPVEEAIRRPNFESLTPIFPNERIHLDIPGGSPAMRIVDLLSPIGKGQRGMIASQPKAGKTTLLKDVANAVTKNHPDMNVIILLIDERPEEVTDIKESIISDKVEVIHSTFDETPEHHKKVAEMVLERAKRLVEHGSDVMILLDSITRLTRAYNLTVAPSGRTLSGGLDPAALHMPKKFFGAARNMREGGSLTILATALVETGSRMDDVVFEEFKGTGNMELMLSRKMSEKRIFPAIEIQKSGTRRDDLLLSKEEQDAAEIIHKMIGGAKAEENVEKLLDVFKHTRSMREVIGTVLKMKP